MTSIYSENNTTSLELNEISYGVISTSLQPIELNTWHPVAFTRAGLLINLLSIKSFILSSAIALMSLLFLVLSVLKLINIFPLIFVNIFIFGLGISLTILVKNLHNENN